MQLQRMTEIMKFAAIWLELDVMLSVVSQKKKEKHRMNTVLFHCIFREITYWGTMKLPKKDMKRK